jgi:hypothetical protein
MAGDKPGSVSIEYARQRQHDQRLNRQIERPAGGGVVPIDDVLQAGHARGELGTGGAWRRAVKPRGP